MSTANPLEQLRRRMQPQATPAAFAALAEEHRRAGRLAEAIAVCREGLERYPTYVSARVTLGRALLDSGEVVDAVGELERAVGQAPDNLAAVRALEAARVAHADQAAAPVEAPVLVEAPALTAARLDDLPAAPSITADALTVALGTGPDSPQELGLDWDWGMPPVLGVAEPAEASLADEALVWPLHADEVAAEEPVSGTAAPDPWSAEPEAHDPVAWVAGIAWGELPAPSGPDAIGTAWDLPLADQPAPESSSPWDRPQADATPVGEAPHGADDWASSVAGAVDEVFTHAAGTTVDQAAAPDPGDAPDPDLTPVAALTASSTIGDPTAGDHPPADVLVLQKMLDAVRARRAALTTEGSDIH